MLTTTTSSEPCRTRSPAITSIRVDVLLVDEGIGAADAEFNERAAHRLRDFYGASGTFVLSPSPTPNDRIPGNHMQTNHHQGLHT